MDCNACSGGDSEMSQLGEIVGKSEEAFPYTLLIFNSISSSCDTAESPFWLMEHFFIYFKIYMKTPTIDRYLSRSS